MIIARMIMINDFDFLMVSTGPSCSLNQTSSAGPNIEQAHTRYICFPLLLQATLCYLED